jgi:glycosyltransferase involved in cell wall biosynthesis
MLKLSLIIPTFNEERHIEACLKAIAMQTVKPFEVIVVDNNSTDKTLEIAEKYDFVSVIKESKQGRGYARTAGFNGARGDILARIDADSRIHIDWVERVQKRFNEDSNLAGITGLAYTDIVPGTHKIKAKIFSRSYFWFAHADFNTVTMWGANMALRAEDWKKVASKVCLDDSKVHEDQDVSLWIAVDGGKIIQDNKLLITTNGQTYRYMPKMLHYIRLHKSTKALHLENGNLKSPRLNRLGKIKTLPGRVFGTFVALYMVLLSVLLFPIDYVVFRFNKHASWLD